jgi:hypothetical protein
MSDNILYITILAILNSSEIEVTDWILKYYLDDLALSSDFQPKFMQIVRQKNCQISQKKSNFFNWTNLFHYLQLMAVVTE